jgi:hypothetical protein
MRLDLGGFDRLQLWAYRRIRMKYQKSFR